MCASRAFRFGPSLDIGGTCLRTEGCSLVANVRFGRAPHCAANLQAVSMGAQRTQTEISG
jgi:hypothetical protein